MSECLKSIFKVPLTKRTFKFSSLFYAALAIPLVKANVIKNNTLNQCQMAASLLRKIWRQTEKSLELHSCKSTFWVTKETMNNFINHTKIFNPPAQTIIHLERKVYYVLKWLACKLDSWNSVLMGILHKRFLSLPFSEKLRAK